MNYILQEKNIFLSDYDERSYNILYTQSDSFSVDSERYFIDNNGLYLNAWPLNNDGRLPGEIFNHNTTSIALLESTERVNMNIIAARGLGILPEISIDKNGYIVAEYSNEESYKVYQIPISTFINPNNFIEVSLGIYDAFAGGGEFVLRNPSLDTYLNTLSYSVYQSKIDYTSFIGTKGVDLIYGDDENNNISGLNGNDVINGRFGENIINGNEGNDTIHGGEGNDWILGGEEDDILSGEGGADVFVFNPENGGNDTILDFVMG